MLTFRDATENDARLISHIHAVSWQAGYRGLIPDACLDRLPDGYWVPSVRSWLGSGQMYGRIALLDGKPVGCVIFGRGRDADWSDRGEIASLYLLPEAMRRGIGSALLRQAEALLAEDGYRGVYLWAIEGSSGTDAFYRRSGYVPTGDRIPYRIGGRDVADIRYVKNT